MFLVERLNGDRPLYGSPVEDEVEFNIISNRNFKRDLQDSKPKKQYSFPQNSGSSGKSCKAFQVKNASLEDRLKDVFSSLSSPGN